MTIDCAAIISLCSIAPFMDVIGQVCCEILCACDYEWSVVSRIVGTNATVGFNFSFSNMWWEGTAIFMFLPVLHSDVWCVVYMYRLDWDVRFAGANVARVEAGKAACA